MSDDGYGGGGGGDDYDYDGPRYVLIPKSSTRGTCDTLYQFQRWCLRAYLANHTVMKLLTPHIV
jgi:hypothetical protein